MADRQSPIGPAFGRKAGFLRRLFPERQILVRAHGQIRCFSLGGLHQLLVVGVVAGFVLWALLATAAYFDRVATVASKDDEIAHRAAELDGIKANYQATFGRLDEFQALFSSITCEITDIQDSLMRIAERSAPADKKGAAAAAMPRLDPDAARCRKLAMAGRAGAADPTTETSRIVGALKGPASAEQQLLQRRVAQLEEALARLKASHGAFLQHSAEIAEARISKLERSLSATGVNPKSLVADRGRARPETEEANSAHYGAGGPFIAARPGGKPPPSDILNTVALFNYKADRLDLLNRALRYLPLGEPLDDYELTSTFGARNDPINAQSGIHEGVDLGAATGTPVASTGDGQVISAGWRDRYGQLVEIDHGSGLHTRYAHLSKILVKVGDKVKRGNTIGLVGVTGRTTGPHLHYEVRVNDQPNNPMKFITAGHDVLNDQ